MTCPDDRRARGEGSSVAAGPSTLPIVALRDLSLVDAALTAAGSFGFLLLSAAVFYAGLRRYESGNLLAMRE